MQETSRASVLIQTQKYRSESYRRTVAMCLPLFFPSYEDRSVTAFDSNIDINSKALIGRMEGMVTEEAEAGMTDHGIC